MLDAPGPRLKFLIDQGLEARKRGEHQKGLAFFERAMRRQPRHLGARLEAACQLRMVGRPNEAEVALRELMTDAPGLVRARIELAVVLRDLDRLDEAETLLQSVRKVAPDNVRALMELARLVQARGDLEGFRHHLEGVIAVDPKHVGARIELANLLAENDEFEKSRAELKDVIAHGPPNVAVWMRLGALERRCNDHTAALAAFHAAFERFPEHLQLLVEAAVEQRMLGRPRDSERLLREVLTKDPTHLGALIQLSEHYWLSGDDNKTLVCCHQAALAHPDNLQLLLLASRAWAALGRDDRAFGILDAAVGKFGARAEISSRRVELLTQIGEWGEARRVLAGHANDAKPNFHLQMLKIQLDVRTGAFDQADDTLRRMSPASRFEQSRTLTLQGQLAEAQWRLVEASALYREALVLKPDDGWILSELARVSLMLVDLDTVRDCIDRLARVEASRLLLRDQSLNPSQTYFGQILDEYMLDRDSVDRLAKSLRLSPCERLEPVRALVAERPDSTASAVVYLISMRQAGVFARQSEPTGFAPFTSPSIPRVLVQFWDAPDPPPQIAAIMKSWIDVHPEFGYVRFDDASAIGFLEQRCPDAVQAFRRARHAARRADLFRLAYLFVEGGFYADADDRCFARVDRLLPSDARLAFYQEEHGSLGNNFLAAAPGDPVIAAALRGAIVSIMRNDEDVVWLSTGPGLLTRAFAHACATCDDLSSPLNKAVVLTRGEIQSAVAMHCLAGYKKTGKHWVRDAFGRNRRKASARLKAPQTLQVPEMPAR